MQQWHTTKKLSIEAFFTFSDTYWLDIRGRVILFLGCHETNFMAAWTFLTKPKGLKTSKARQSRALAAAHDN